MAAVPAYAQAVTQVWAELLDGGNLLQGDMPMPPVNYNIPADIPAPISYRFWSGSQNIPVYIRQAVSEPTTLLVVGTVQPQASVRGNIPVVVNASIQLPPPAKTNTLTTFEFRRQGSVYVVKIDTKSGGVGSVVQLDGWHEQSHPSWWSRDLHIEAELHDGFRPADVGTDPLLGTEQMPSAATHDFSQFTTFVTLPASAAGSVGAEDFGAGMHELAVEGRDVAVDAPPSALVYTVQPRCIAETESKHEFFLRMRSRENDHRKLADASTSTHVCGMIAVGSVVGEACVSNTKMQGFAWTQVNFKNTSMGEHDGVSTSVLHLVRDQRVHVLLWHVQEDDGGGAWGGQIDVDALRVSCVEKTRSP
jgi:hypothetical protein